MIKFLQIGHQGVDVLAGMSAQFDEVADHFALAQIVVVKRGDRTELDEVAAAIVWAGPFPPICRSRGARVL